MQCMSKQVYKIDWLITGRIVVSVLCCQGILLHPYLSLHLLHLLTDVSVRGFVIGATNALFRQKTHLVDVVVEVSF